MSLIGQLQAAWLLQVARHTHMRSAFRGYFVLPSQHAKHLKSRCTKASPRQWLKFGVGPCWPCAIRTFCQVVFLTPIFPHFSTADWALACWAVEIPFCWVDQLQQALTPESGKHQTLFRSSKILSTCLLPKGRTQGRSLQLPAQGGVTAGRGMITAQLQPPEIGWQLPSP